MHALKNLILGFHVVWGNEKKGGEKGDKGKKQMGGGLL